MTIAELVEELPKLPPHLPVVFERSRCSDEEPDPVDSVRFDGNRVILEKP